MAMAGEDAAHGIDDDILQQELDRGRDILAPRALGQIEDMLAHGRGSLG